MESAGRPAVDAVRASLQLSVPAAALDRLHDAALRILETTGVRFDSERAVAVLRRGGASLDGRVARFTPRLVEWALSITPQAYDLYDRQGRVAIRRGAPEQPWFNVGGGTHQVLDWSTGAVRPFMRQDAVEVARLSDVLPQVLQVSSAGAISDVPAGDADRHAFVIRIENSCKPVDPPARSLPALRAMLDFLAWEAGGREELSRHPTCQVGINVMSPLVYDEAGCDMLLEGIEFGIPVSGSGWPQPGATAPVTLAGAVAVAHAECLAGLLLAQMAREGARYHTYGSTPPFDMRAMICATGAPERALGDALLVQLARRCNLPSACTAVSADAKEIDLQAGAERAMQCLAATLAGADIVGGLGWLDSSNVFSPELLVLDCEMAEAVRRVRAPIDLDETALALDVIDEVGPAGHFLDAHHTLAHFRKAVWYPGLWERSTRRPDAEEQMLLRKRTRQRISELLASHRPPTLSSSTRRALDAVIG